MNIKIGSTVAPFQYGKWLYVPPRVLSRSGDGLTNHAAFGSATWTFAKMSREEIAFFAGLLDGALSKSFNHLSGYDSYGVATSWNQCVMLAPTHQGFKGIRFENVVVKFEQIR